MISADGSYPKVWLCANNLMAFGGIFKPNKFVASLSWEYGLGNKSESRREADASSPWKIIPFVSGRGGERLGGGGWLGWRVGGGY